MTTQNMTTQRKGIVGGIALILIGLLAFVAQTMQSETMGLLILPALAAIFLVWGIVTRNSGLLVPAGILGGVGVGALLVAGPFASLAGDVKGGAVALSLGLGFIAITLLSTIFTDKKHVWALIPGTTLALVGAALLLGGVGLQALALLGSLWPLVLIAIGAYIIFGRAKA